MLPLITEPYLLYWTNTSFFDCEPCARQSTSGPCAPTVGLVPASFVIIIYLSYLTITPSTFGLSVGLISVLMPWYLNFRFIRWSSQLLDALLPKPQFIHWSPQFTDALVPKPPVFLLTDSYT
jgi:hypothetical protein